MELDTVVVGDCLDILPTIPDQSVDAVITDPPYPHIKRDYGYWTTEEWWALIVEGVIPEVRRILKPTGSAVFILQPNSEHVGQMRGWLWEFMAWACREWNMVQDVWWWNINMPPSGGINQGFLRPSLKSCVWCGSSDCFHDISKVLGEASPSMRYLKRYMERKEKRLETTTSGRSFNRKRTHSAWIERGGVMPFNVLPIGVSGVAVGNAGANGHGAGTPLELADWWTRYIVPPGGVVCDPFFGVGTMGVAAVQNGCSIIGIDKMPGYIRTARERVAEARREYAKAQQESSQLELSL